MKRSRTEYRITIKRAGRAERTIVRCSEAATRKFLQLLGPTPWLAYAPEADADDFMCCSGTRYDECGCGGVTHAEHAATKRKEYTPLQWVRVESRRRTWELTPWAAPTLGRETAIALGQVEANRDEPDEKWDKDVKPEEVV